VLAVRGDSRAVAVLPIADTHALRVCSDPNNLPYSNSRGEGFENLLATDLAASLHRRLAYYWRPMRRGFIRNTLKAQNCDVVIGVPASFELARTTRPYYRSTYVFVSRADRGLHLTSFDDRRLRRLRTGIQITGDDYENPPPAQALATRGIISNVRGFMVYGDYSRPDPQRALIDAVVDGQIDVAVMWGPQAGYFGSRADVALDITPVSPQIDLPDLPFVFDMSMGVRREDQRLFEEVDRYIETNQQRIRELLRRYHVPLIAKSGS